MWESPINIYETVSDMVEKEIDGNIIVEIKKQLGIDINKEELIKALQYDRNQYDKGYQDGLNADRWISVDDKLPKEVSTILVLLKNGFVTIARYRFGEFIPTSNLFDKFVENNPILSWQPLPKAPN